jgi:hypothetical protein
MNPTHFIGCGWIASISGIDLSEDEAFKLFDKVALRR